MALFDDPGVSGVEQLVQIAGSELRGGHLDLTIHQFPVHRSCDVTEDPDRGRLGRSTGEVCEGEGRGGVVGVRGVEVD